MTTKELIKPRFKVIADFPCSSVIVGEIIRTGESLMAYVVSQGEFNEKECLTDYPHLFKRLNWWDERSEKDMPDRIVLVSDGKETFYSVIMWDMENHTGSPRAFLAGGVDRVFLSNSTETSYYLPA
jgi:hypothetical protein